MSHSSCPLSFEAEGVSLPGSLYNYSYYGLFPAPYCPQCGYGFNSKGQCVSLEPVSNILNNASLYTSGKCPYGHIDLPGMGCTNLLTGPFRAPVGSTVVNGQVSRTGVPRHSGSPCCDVKHCKVVE